MINPSVKYSLKTMSEIAELGMRFIPIGDTYRFVKGYTFYEYFLIHYGNSYSQLNYMKFRKIFNVVFPLYKNKRRKTKIVKISNRKLELRLFKLGIENFPYEILLRNERLKIESL